MSSTRPHTEPTRNRSVGIAMHCKAWASFLEGCIIRCGNGSKKPIHWIGLDQSSTSFFKLYTLRVVLGNALLCVLLGMNLSLYQHGSFTSEVTIDPGAIPETAVLAHILRTSLKTAISCLALQNIAGVSLSSNNKDVPQHEGQLLSSWKLLRWLHNFRSLWIEPGKVCRATFLLTRIFSWWETYTLDLLETVQFCLEATLRTRCEIGLPTKFDHHSNSASLTAT